MGRNAASIEGAAFGAVVPAPAGYLPPYVRAVIEEAAQAGLRPLSRPTRPHDPETPALVAVMRDEAPRLPGFLAHYRRLGVTRFAVIDNGSRDATRALLAAEPDVALYATDRLFPGKQGWVNALIARMGYDRWYLHVDADERLVFDGAPAEGRPGRGLAELVRFAEAGGFVRLRAMLVDLYPPGRLAAPASGGPPLAPEARNLPLASEALLFDGDGYAETLCLERISRKGGPRRRAFGFDPELTKYPLFRIRAGEVAASPHHLHPYRENYRSDCLLALLHDKFGPGWRARAERAAAEGNYWQASLEYRATLAALESDPGLALAYPGSRRYCGPADLVAAGLIAPIPWAGRPSLAGRVAGWTRRRAVARA
jgi:Glycosyl transferase family 2